MRLSCHVRDKDKSLLSPHLWERTVEMKQNVTIGFLFITCYIFLGITKSNGLGNKLSDSQAKIKGKIWSLGMFGWKVS